MISRILVLSTLLGILLVVALFPGCDKLITQNNDNTVIDTTLGAACLSCHTDGNDSVIVVPRDQWANSAHANAKYIEAAVTIDDSTFFTNTCGPVCHSGNGFVDSIEFHKSPINAAPSVINCYTCHLPHTGKYGSWKLDTLRGQESPLIMNNLRPYAYGQSTLCAICHQARVAPPTGTDDIKLTPGWGPHISPQADVFGAKGGYQFGMVMDSGAHTVAIMKNGCVDCHFGEGRGYDYGEHTFRLQYKAPKDTTPYLANCNVGTCHSSRPITSFTSFDSAAVIQHYLDTLKYALSVFGALDSTGSDPTKINVDSTISAKTAQILYNYLLVQNDGTHGIHNPWFVSRLLRESIIRVDSIPPQARFVTVGDTAACAPITVSFENKSRGKFTSFKWDFGDNNLDSTNVAPTHTYDTAGAFSPKLTITGPGGTSTFTRPNGVLSGGKPNANLYLPGLEGCKPMSLILVDSTIGLKDSVRWTLNSTVTNTWRQGDPLTNGLPRFLVPAFYIGDSVGIFPLSVEMIVWNECGSDTVTRDLLDTAIVDTLPTARFVVSDTSTPPEIPSIDILFTNLTDSSRGIDSVVWYVAGNRIGNGWEPTPNPRNFSQGVWPVKMIVYNRCGSDESDEISLRIGQSGGSGPLERKEEVSTMRR